MPKLNTTKIYRKKCNFSLFLQGWEEKGYHCVNGYLLWVNKFQHYIKICLLVLRLLQCHIYVCILWLIPVLTEVQQVLVYQATRISSNRKNLCLMSLTAGSFWRKRFNITAYLHKHYICSVNVSCCPSALQNYQSVWTFYRQIQWLLSPIKTVLF